MPLLFPAILWGRFGAIPLPLPLQTSASGDDAAAFMVEVDFQLDSEEEDKYAFWRDSSDEEEVQSHYAYVDEAIQGLAAEFIQSLPSARAARYAWGFREEQDGDGTCRYAVC